MNTLLSDQNKTKNNVADPTSPNISAPNPQNTGFGIGGTTDLGAKALEGAQGAVAGSFNTPSAYSNEGAANAGRMGGLGGTQAAGAADSKQGAAASGFGSGLGGTLATAASTSNANAPALDPATKTSPTTQPDYNGLADTAFRNLTQQMTPFHEAQRRSAQQRMAENGMTGLGAAAMDDRQRALQNTQLTQEGNKLQQKAMEQQASLDTSKALASFEKELNMEGEELDQAMGMLKGAAGDDAAFTSVLAQLTALYPDNETFKMLAENPDASRVWREELKSGLITKRRAAAGNIIAGITDFSDPAQIQANFKAWNDAMTGGTLDAVVPIKGVENDQALIAEFQQATGTSFNPADPLDVKELSQFKQYKQMVQVAAEGELRDELTKTLAEGGIDVTNQATLNKIAKSATLLSKSIESPVKLGNLTASFDGDTRNGTFSHLFTDWAGVPYQDNSVPGAVDKKLDEVWEDYVQTTIDKGEKPMPRTQWYNEIGKNVLQMDTRLEVIPANAWQMVQNQIQQAAPMSPESAKDVLTKEALGNDDKGRFRMYKAIGELSKSPTDLQNFLNDPTTKAALERNGIFTGDVASIQTQNTTEIGGLKPGMIFIHDGQPFIYTGIEYKEGGNLGGRWSAVQGYKLNPDGNIDRQKLNISVKRD